MTTLRPYRQMRQQVAFTMIVALAFSQVRTSAALVYLNGRGDGLNSPLSFQKWTPGVTGDTLVWAGPLPAGAATINVHSRGLGTINVDGIQIASTASGALTLQAANVTGGGTQTINLGAGGIDMAEASQNLTINKTNGSGTVALNLTAAQTWDIGAGRTSVVNANSTGSNQLTLATLGAGSALTVGGAINLGAAMLDIQKQGTGAMSLNGAVTAGTLNVVNGVTGNLGFGSSVTAPVIAVDNQSNGSLTFTGAVNASTSTTINSQSSGGLTFGSTLNTGALNVSTNSNGTATYSGVVTANTINLQRQSSGTLTFSNSVNAATSLDINVTKNAAVNVNLNNSVAAPITAPTFNLTTQSSGNVTFGTNANIVANTAFNLNALGSSTYLMGGTVSAGTMNVDTNIGTALSFSRSVTSTAGAIDIDHNSTGALTFSNTVNAATTFDVNATKSSVLSFNGNITAPTFNLKTYGNSATTFGTAASPTAINASTAFNLDVLGTNTTTINSSIGASNRGAVNVNIQSLSTSATAGVLFGTTGAPRIVNATTMNVVQNTVSTLATSLLFSDNVDATTSLSLTNYRGTSTQGTIKFNGDVTAPTITINNYGAAGLSFGQATAPKKVNASSGLTLSSFGSGSTTIASCTTVTGSTSVTTTASTAGIIIGMVVSGTGIQNGSIVTAVNSPTAFTISLPATASSGATPVTLTFQGSITAFDSTIGETNAGAVTLNSHGNSVLALNRAVTATNLTLLRNSTGATTFASTTNASSLNLTGTRSGPTTFSGAVTSPVVSLNTLSTGSVTFSNTLNATTGVNFKALAANTITFTGAVTAGTFGTAVTPNVTHGTLLLSSTLTAPEVNVISAGTGNATFTGAVNSTTSFAYSAFGNNTATINNLTSPLIDLTTNSTSGTALTLAGAVNGFTTLNITNGGTGTVTVSNTVAANLTGNGASTVNLTQNSTGTITVGGATGGAIAGASTALNINFTGLSGVGGTVNLNATNTFGGATSITGGTTNLGYATTNTSKLADAAALTLNRAVLNIVGAAASGHPEVVGSTVIGAGFSQITRSTGTGVLRLNGTTRNVGGVLDIATASIADTDRLNTNGIIGGWATLAGTDWAINSTGAGDGAVTAYTGYTTNVAVNTWTTATQNIRASAALTGTFGGGTINSLKLDTAAQTMAHSLNAAMVIGSGGILTTGNFNRTIGSLGIAGTLTAGTVTDAVAYRASAANSELFFHINQAPANAVTVNLSIIDNGALTPSTIGLVKSSGGTLVLNATNTYTGQTTIAGGTLQIGSGSTTGTLGSGNVVNNGILDFRRSDSIAVSNSISGIGAVTQNNATSILTLSGNNTYMGATNLTLGGITAGSATALSPNSTFNFANVASAVLNLGGFNSEVGGLSGGGATGGNVTLGAANLTVGRNNSTTIYSGIISGSGNVTKVGNGVLTLAVNNTFTGTLTVGTLDRNLGGVTVQGTTAITGATVNGGTLTFQPSATNNTAKTIAGNVTVNGGTFSFGTNANGVNTITGNLAASNAAVVGFSGTTSTGAVTGTTTLNNASAMTVANIGRFTGLVSVNDQATLALTSGTATNTFTGGLTVGAAAALTLAGHNTFGAAVTLNNSGTLTAPGFQNFGDALTIGSGGAGNLVATLGNNETSSQFLGPVTVSAGSLTLGATRTVSLTGSSTAIGNTTITTASTAGLTVGMAVSGTNIPANAAISSITNATQYVITGTAPTTAGSSLTHTATSQLVGMATTVGLTSVTCSHTGLLVPGMVVTNANFAPGTTVVSITNTTTFVVDKPALGTATAQVGALSGASVLANSTTNGTTTVTTASTAGLVVGMSITGTNIPTGATVATIDPNGTTFTLSVPATGSASNLRLGAVARTRFAGLLTVNNAGSFTSNANNRLEGGLLVDGGGTITSMTGNNTFGLTPGGSAGRPSTTRVP